MRITSPLNTPTLPLQKYKEKPNMKYFIVLLALLFATVSFAGVSTDLSEEVVIKKPATTLYQDTFTWHPDYFEVLFMLKDADGTVVDNKTCFLKDWEEAGANAFCSDAQFVRQADCELVNTWIPLVPADDPEPEVPAHCSNPVFTDQTSCEVVDVWTPQEIIEHNDFSDGDGAVIGSGAVGNTYKSTIENYLQNKCMQKWGYTAQ